jgi:hypothetical protein
MSWTRSRASIAVYLNPGLGANPGVWDTRPSLADAQCLTLIANLSKNLVSRSEEGFCPGFMMLVLGEPVILSWT